MFHLVLILLTFSFVLGFDQKNIHVNLKTTWNNHAILAEASEFFSSLGNEAFWNFHESLQSQTTNAQLSPRDQYQLVLTVARNITGPSTLEVLKYSLALHFHSPKVETFHQLFLNELHTHGQSTYNQTLECPVVIHVSGQDTYVCAATLNSQQVTQAVQKGIKASQKAQSEIFEFDQVYPGNANPNASIVFVYAEFDSIYLSKVHPILVDMVRTVGIRYILRPKINPWTYNSPLYVQGFGVELDIKNMEYKVIDDTKINLAEMDLGNVELPDTGEGDQEIHGFYFRRLIQRKPELKNELERFRAELIARDDEEEKTVKVWDMKNLGFQAAQRIFRASDPLIFMQDLCQNFPMYANALTHLKLDKSLSQAIQERHKNTVITPGMNEFTINGVSINAEEVDVFQLHDLFHFEASTIDHLRKLHLPASTVRTLLSLPPPPTHQTQQMGGGFGMDTGIEWRLDMDTGNDEGPITWLNDISKDPRYNPWSSSIFELLSPGWPNQLRYIRKNLYHGIVVFDPTTVLGLSFAERANYFVEANAPIRIGLIFWIPAAQEPKLDTEVLKDGWGSLTSEKVDSTMSLQEIVARIFRYLELNQGRDKAWSFIKKLVDLGRNVTESDIRAKLKAIAGRNWESYEEILKDDEGSGKAFVEKTRQYTSERALSEHQYPCIVVNGILFRGGSETNFRELMMKGILGEQQSMQMKVYRGIVGENTNLHEHFSNLPGTYKRLSLHILQAPSDVKFVSQLPAPLPLSQLDKMPVTQPRLLYFQSSNPETEFQTKALSMWIVVDVSTLPGLNLLKAALTLISDSKLKESGGVRIALLHNPIQPLTTPQNHLTAGVLYTLTRYLTPSKALPVVREVVALARYFDSNANGLKAALLKLGDQVDAKGKKKFPAQVKAVIEGKDNSWVAEIQKSLSYVQNVLHIQAGVIAAAANGRLVTFPEQFTSLELLEDLKLLYHYESSSQNLEKVKEALDATSYLDLDPDDQTSDWVNEVALQASYVLAKRATHNAIYPTSSSIASLDSGNSLGIIQYPSETSFIKIQVALDPLSKAAQRLTPVLVALRDSFDVDITIFLNPQPSVGDFPLKRFYRYAVSSSLAFDDQGQTKPPSGALFRGLRTAKVLTLQLTTPESWLVESSFVTQDTDNILLQDISGDTLYVVYTLEHLLIAGNSFDPTTHEPPAGLQLTLSTPRKSNAGDTLVMQNLGYFQLKANPGVWSLKVDELHASVYQIDNEENSDSEQVVVNTFIDPVQRLPVKRRPGQERTKLDSLTASNSDSGVGGFLKSLWGSGAEKNETIHVFSIASGWLYERFLKIMMLSVTKSTKNPVKFWFIKNFLSPQFREFAPKMAAHYGYEVEFVTYRWPNWLRQQEVKQRVIWGYKILFLDVLFPLALKRVIYIDADQVVRGDIKELWEMNLNGAPYAYTPFCDSNKDTEGFRFWKQGYWAEHLRGHKYHISALYVVDLDKFRRMRAGDSLRVIYDNLSADKNSLANLDQDLPNYAQHMVPIHSLPQEWLWCQTWCSMESLATAKTIDLCNNPLTKTPKLEVARTLLPEWTVLDNEAKSLDDVFVTIQPTPTLPISTSSRSHAPNPEELEVIKNLQQNII